MTAKRVVRSLKPTHLVGLRALDSRASCVEITSPSWPRIANGDARLPFWSLLSHSLAHHAGRRRAWIIRGGAGIEGVVVARVRCGGLVWDVRHLWADDARAEVIEALLERVGEDAVQRGVRRVFLELPHDAAALAAAGRVGFQRYTGAELLVQPDAERPAPTAWEPRTRRRGDELGLFQLYKAAVPASVRAAEAMTLEEWVALHKGSRRWSPRQLSDRVQYLWDAAEGLAAWAELASTGRSQHVEWHVHPDYEGDCDALVGGVLKRAQARAALWVTCREYQQSLRSALVRIGFVPAAESAVLVCQLAVRVPERAPERALVAAPVRSIAGG